MTVDDAASSDLPRPADANGSDFPDIPHEAPGGQRDADCRPSAVLALPANLHADGTITAIRT